MCTAMCSMCQLTHISVQGFFFLLIKEIYGNWKVRSYLSLVPDNLISYAVMEMMESDI